MRLLIIINYSGAYTINSYFTKIQKGISVGYALFKQFLYTYFFTTFITFNNESLFLTFIK